MVDTETEVSDTLHFFRGFVAIVVMITHFRNIIYVEYSQIALPVTLFDKFVYFCSGLGDQSVMVFFVLSGYFIGKNVHSEIKHDYFSWKKYLINRLVRLYVVLLPALLISVIFVKVGDLLFLERMEDINIDTTTLWGNLLFTQTILTHAYAGNIPLWSLANEFYYYGIFPCLLLFIYKKNLKYRILYLIATLFFFTFITKMIALYFLIWLMGFSVHILPKFKKIKTKSSFRLFCTVVLYFALISSLVLSRAHVFEEVSKNFIVAIIFSLLLFILIHNNKVSKKRLYHKLSVLISSFSYSLYLTHYPIVLFIKRLIGTPAWQPDRIHIIYGFALVSAIYLFAYLFSRVTEANTNKIRVFIIETFGNIPVFLSKAKKLS